MALAEAMACGAAVVASRSGAFNEIVWQRRKSGLLVPPLDTFALADAIQSSRKITTSAAAWQGTASSAYNAISRQMVPSTKY